MLVILRKHARHVASVEFICVSSAVQVVLNLTLLLFKQCMCQAALQSNRLQQCCLIADSSSERNRRQGSLLLNCNGRCGCQGCAAVRLFGNEPRVCKHGKNRNAVVAYLSAAHFAMLPCDPSWPITKILVSYLSYQHAGNFSVWPNCCGQHYHTRVMLLDASACQAQSNAA